MLLVIDVGNTNIVLGLFADSALKGTFRLTTKQARTSDEYGMSMMSMLEQSGFDPVMIEAVIISSVVPDLMHSLVSGIQKYLHQIPIVVGPGMKTGIRIVTANPREIGPDRIVDAVAAYELYGGPVLVIDFGTATTYDLVSEDGSFLAGITAPGIRTAARSLWEDAAKLPEFEIKKPESILAQETITSLQAGLVYGYVGSAEYIIRKVREESGFSDMKVVATGGLGKIIVDETDTIDIYDSSLTLKGLRLIYEKNRKPRTGDPVRA